MIDSITKQESLTYKIQDIGLAEFGRKEIEIAEKEMPGLMSLRNKYKMKSPYQVQESWARCI
jgi:adenosylhomocysteinase